MESRPERITKVVFKSRIHVGEFQKLSKILQTKGSNFHRLILNFFFAIHYMLSISFSVFRSVVNLRTKQGRRN